MELTGIEQGASLERTIAVINQFKKLMQLQGELVVQLIDSAKVPGPQDTSKIRGLGARVDLHI